MNPRMNHSIKTMSLTNVLQLRSGLGELFLLGLGELARPVGLGGLSSLTAVSNLLPTTGGIHGGRRHVLVDILASQVVALSLFTSVKPRVMCSNCSCFRSAVALSVSNSGKASAARIYESAPRLSLPLPQKFRTATFNHYTVLM